jgi:hypothetical protein
MDRRGRKVTGQVTAATRDGVVASLKEAGIAVASVEEVGAIDTGHNGAPSGAIRWRPKRSWSLVFFSIAAFTAAWLFSTLQPVDVIRCDGERHCSIEHWIVGDGDHHVQELAGVERVTAESREEIREGGSRRPNVVIQRSALALHGAKSSIEADAVHQPIPASSQAIAEQLQAFLVQPSAAGYTAWQGELGPVVTSAIFAFLGLILGLSAFKVWRSEG